MNIRLTLEEHKKVCQYAQSSAMTPANWIRQKAFTGKFPVIKLSPVDAALYRELHKIGVNLNQAVKLVHSGKLPVGMLPVLEKLTAIQMSILNCLLE